MKKLALIAVVVGLGLVLCGSEGWAKGGSSGRSPGAGRGSAPSRGPGAGKGHQPRPGTHRPNTNSRPSHGTGTSRGPGHGGRPSGRDVPRTSRGGSGSDRGDLSGEALPGSESAEASFGMVVRELHAGTARKQGMKVGDIIMSINGTATPDYDALRSALVDSGSQAEVDFINVDNGELERITLSPTRGAIGASVEQIEVD
jgi:hypothetical protein